MKSTSFKAPGKALLCGEYAVLRGAPAMCVALNCRAQVTVSKRTETVSIVSTLGFAEGSWRFKIIDGSVAWLDQPPQGVKSLLDAACKKTPLTSCCPAALTIDTLTFYSPRDKKKLGLGSSSAATVALVAALQKQSFDIESIWANSKMVHKALQNGRGSGIDIATSCFGGLITYKSCDTAPPNKTTWPTGLYYQFFYSGIESDTMAAIDRAAGVSEKSWNMLIEHALDAAIAWGSGTVEEILDTMEQYTVSLRKLDLLYGLNIFGAGHQDLVDLAKTTSLMYKPCGSGGGDIGVALSKTKKDLQDFSQYARMKGFMPLDLEIDNNGVMSTIGEKV